MPSTLTWLDHDAAARERSLRILALFQEKESRDELGLGVLRDALADRLFPGTSTIQTRLRYMLFVPWIYTWLEEQRVPAEDLVPPRCRHAVCPARGARAAQAARGRRARARQDARKLAPAIARTAAGLSGGGELRPEARGGGVPDRLHRDHPQGKPPCAPRPALRARGRELPVAAPRSRRLRAGTPGAARSRAPLLGGDARRGAALQPGAGRARATRGARRGAPGAPAGLGS